MRGGLRLLHAASRRINCFAFSHLSTLKELPRSRAFEIRRLSWQSVSSFPVRGSWPASVTGTVVRGCRWRSSTSTEAALPKFASAQGKGDCLEEAISLALDKMQAQLGKEFWLQDKDFLTVLFVNDSPPMSGSQAVVVLEGLNQFVPEKLQAKLLGAVSYPHRVTPPNSEDESNRQAHWAAMHCLVLPSGTASEVFTSSTDSLPDLKSYRELLASDKPHTFLILCNQSFKRKSLLHRLQMLFPEGPKLCGLMSSSHFMYQSEVVPGSVGFVLAGSDFGTELREFCKGVIGSVGYQDIQADPSTMQELFLPTRSPLRRTNKATGEQFEDWVGLAKGLTSVSSKDMPIAVYTDPSQVEPPQAGKILDKGPDGVPLFVLKWQVPLIPNSSTVFNIFEPRYKHMIKTIVDEDGHFVLATPDNEVGTACKVVWMGVKEEDGSSLVEVVGTCRVRITERWIRPNTFGLTYGSAEVVEDEPVPEAEQDETKTLSALATEMLEQLLSRYLPREEIEGRMKVMNGMEPSALSFWLIESLRVQHDERHKWLAMTSVKERLRAQTDVLRALLVSHKNEEKDTVDVKDSPIE